MICKKSYDSFHVSAANQVRNEPVSITACGEVHNSPSGDSGWLNQSLKEKKVQLVS